MCSVRKKNFSLDHSNMQKLIKIRWMIWFGICMPSKIFDVTNLHIVFVLRLELAGLPSQDKLSIH